MNFCTILNNLKSPQNVGMIVRSHIAYGGKILIFTGQELPWKFKKGSQAFSRKLERQCNIMHIPLQADVLDWCKEKEYASIAIEIKENPTYLDKFSFPDKCAIIVGNEGTGLDKDFLSRCNHVLTVPQYGNVGSLNVAVSASIAMYEFNRGRKKSVISGTKYIESKV